MSNHPAAAIPLCNIIQKQRASTYDNKRTLFDNHHSVPSGFFQEEQWDNSAWTLLLTDEVIATAVKSHGFKSPVSLNLSGATGITDAALLSIANVSGKLKMINLQDASKISERGFLPMISCSRVVQSLNVSGCTGIAGSALAVIGKYASSLHELDLSRCSQLTPWTFTKIFEGCRNLRSLNCSYCYLITDNELRVLGDNCNQLECLSLKECREISDMGITYISYGCKLLQSLNLSRSDLAIKISDISLLSLADNCRELVSISLSGCEKISDTGIAWLTSGCKKLRVININNCHKVTNKGMRCIGEACVDLKLLFLKNASEVTDMGIRYIADGCHHIEQLNFSGLRMLSSGDKCNTKKGLQALSASKASGSIKSINLDRCVRIGRSALHAIAGLKSLEILTLSSCPNICMEGIAEIAQACQNIWKVSLSSCGSCVTADMVTALSPLFPKLRYLDLSGCNIGKVALAKLALCVHLDHLNLSGCNGVDDDSIFALCEGKFDPGIRYLNLDKCVAVTDLSLAWIVHGLKHESSGNFDEVTVETLQFKETRITRACAEAFVDRFKYSILKNDHSIFGFYALPRSQDMRIIYDYDRRLICIIKIQAIVRRWKQRKLAEKVKQRYHMAKVSTFLAAIRRRQLAKKRLNELRYERWRRWIAALKIQCWYRAHMARRLSDALRRKRWLAVAPFAAMKIQAMFRGIQGRQHAMAIGKQKADQYRSYIEASAKVQNVFRAYRHFKVSLGELKKRRLEAKKREHASNVVRSFWRASVQRSLEQRLRKEDDLKRERILASSKMIFRCLRSARFRTQIRERIINKKLISNEASKIQQWFVVQRAAERRRLLYQEKLNKIKFHSAVVIQMNWRGNLACKVASNLREILKRNLKMKAIMATKISCWWRCCLAQKYVTELRLRRRELLKSQLQLQIWAATKIGSAWRGHQGRLKADAARHVKACRWTKHWDESHGRYFYHDQISGKSQWHKPQEILDLEIRPICNNCSFYEAQIECSECIEYFCFACWDAVHFGGRRSFHNFRSLYDFYGKRISYESTRSTEEEYNSLWPSEIEQDKHGLQLRVNPHRFPSTYVDDCSVYIDENSNRKFIYDERTNEGHYY